MLFDRAMIEGALPTGLIGPVAHYTKIGTLCHFISDNPPGWGSAWATPVQFLNDRKELSLGLEILSRVANQRPRSGLIVRAIIEELLTTFGDPNTDAFQMSFSGNPDELGQWRGYAANGMGCSVVTDQNRVRQVADVAGWVLYDTRKQIAFAKKVLVELQNEIDNYVTPQNEMKNDIMLQKDTKKVLIAQVLAASACYMKHEGFRPEMEFRLLKFPDSIAAEFRESGDRLVPYIDYLKGASSLPVEKILIGPGWQLSDCSPAEFQRNHVVQGVKRLLTARGLHNTEIVSSRIPYDPK